MIFSETYKTPRILLPDVSVTNQTLFVFLCVIQFKGYISIISKRIFLFFGFNCSSCIVLDVSDGHNPWPFFSTMSLFLGPVRSNRQSKGFVSADGVVDAVAVEQV